MQKPKIVRNWNRILSFHKYIYLFCFRCDNHICSAFLLMSRPNTFSGSFIRTLQAKSLLHCLIDDEWFVFLCSNYWNRFVKHKKIVLFPPFDIESCAKLKLIDFQYCLFSQLGNSVNRSNCGFSHSFHPTIHTDQTTVSFTTILFRTSRIIFN